MQVVGLRRALAFLVVGIAMMLAPAALRAQTGRVSGVVTDAASGQPIEGVQIRVSGTGFGALTQSNGRYHIIGVPPGTYTVRAQRIGYQPVEQTGVEVRIDVTREINLRLSAATATLTTLRIEAERTPLVESGVTGSSTAVTTEVIEALPVTSVSGVLSLQQGFLEQPQNTDIVSFSDTRRNVLSPVRIRGGRGGETLTLIDGIPINNVVFGGPAFDVSTGAVQQIDFQKGGFEPQYGNALSGIINIATKEGGTRLAGNLEYQGTGLGGALGSEQDDLANYELYKGYVSGPIPGTSDRLRFLLAGQTQNGADRVLEFDENVFQARQVGQRLPLAQDLFPGWRAFGYDTQHDIFGKLTIIPTTTSKLNLMVVDYERQRQPFDFDYALGGFDVLSSPVLRTLEDSLAVFPSTPDRDYAGLVQGSIRAQRRLYGATFEQRFSRTNVIARIARFDQERQTCNFFNGLCLGPYFADANFNETFVAPITRPVIAGNAPTGTDLFYGGEDVSSNIFRLDAESQVTDHHNIQSGVFYQRHDITFGEVRNLGTNQVTAVPLQYRTKPYDAAAYIQDRIEYDFLTVKLGARFDYGKATGQFFRNPLDPTNGTTAREVCNGNAPSLGATTPYTLQSDNGTPGDPSDDVLLTGLAACTSEFQPLVGTRRELLDQATRLAATDDFAEADARKAFSPRIGLSFPLTERSALFFNAGRYSQNPLYNNLYQNTNVGLTVGDGCTARQERLDAEGICQPTIFADAYTPAYLGNTNLQLEQTTSYEVGYASELSTNYALNVTLFSKDQTGLSGIRASSRSVSDPGVTYGTGAPRYTVIVNQDYATVRGLELQFRRRIANYWGFDVNYSFSKATTNAAPPDVTQQRESQGDPASRREITSEIDQPHVFNAALYLRVGERAPEFRFGNLLRNSYFTITTRAASGLPYTPTLCTTGVGEDCALDVNAGRSPATQPTDLLLGKDLSYGGARYGVFARVVNLLDRKNCLQVYTTTGRCDAGAPDQDRRQNGNAVNAPSSTFFDRAMYYGARRSIFAGARVNF